MVYCILGGIQTKTSQVTVLQMLLMVIVKNMIKAREEHKIDVMINFLQTKWGW